jgi:hypothetical protein
VADSWSNWNATHGIFLINGKLPCGTPLLAIGLIKILWVRGGRTPDLSIDVTL